MIDQKHIEDIRQQADCREVIARDLGKPHSREGADAWAWRCPLHKETKGYSLTAWKDGWKCWGSCGLYGDAIKWLQTYHGMSFQEAVMAFGASDRAVVRSGSRVIVREVRREMPKPAEPPHSMWQKQGLAVVNEAEQLLWAPEGERPMAYLHKRGLTDDTIKQARLGYLPGHYTEYRHYKMKDRLGLEYGYHVPCGILIPWLIHGELWGIKVRRAAGDQKYSQVAGSQISGQGLYWASYILSQTPVLFVEGEFDCLIAFQQAYDICSPVTLGSASNRLNQRWFSKLASCFPLLVAYDADDAGEHGAQALAAMTARARRVKVPSGKDVSDFHNNGGNVYEWIAGLVPQKIAS